MNGRMELPLSEGRDNEGRMAVSWIELGGLTLDL